MQIAVTPQSVNMFQGPFLPHEQQAASKQQPRCILELQDCSIPIPSTENNDAEAERFERTQFSGRLIPPDKANLGLFAQWISLCKKKHGDRCWKPIWPNHESTLASPSLISLLVIDVNKKCVVLAPPQCRYVALSYCWGNAVTLTHTRANSDRLKTEGTLVDSIVPATIRDAMSLVMAVGERFLWVDALCIVQDDFQAKQVQLAQMGLIYSLSSFTIIAAAGQDSNAGLPGVHPGTRRITQETFQVGDKKLLTVIDGPYYGGVQSSHWNTRAWTLQEKALSKRKLVFTNQQVYWDCWSATWLEETVLENVSNPTFSRTPAKAGAEDLDLVLAWREYYRVYRAMVQAYMHRGFTFQSDILNGFSGVSQALAAIHNDDFHWGLPVSRFDWALSWRLIGGGTRNDARHPLLSINSLPHHVRFPSWSWTAWGGSPSSSWIIWMSSSRRLQGEPEIVFYRECENGELVKIEHDCRNRRFVNARTQKFIDASGLLGLRKKWKGQPQTISEATQIVSAKQGDTGRLHFWTSSATLYIKRSAQGHSPDTPYSDLPGYSLLLPKQDGEGFVTSHISIESSAHLPFWDPNVMTDLPRPVLEHIEGEDYTDILIKEFIIVGRSRWVAAPEPSRCRTYLSALIVEREGDVAFRIGEAVIEESVWASLGNREWKRVILG
jgi:hypothetical protein